MSGNQGKAIEINCSLGTQTYLLQSNTKGDTNERLISEAGFPYQSFEKETPSCDRGPEGGI